MSVVQFILTTTAAIGSANAASSRLTHVMSMATGYNETQLHSNVTAYDICMYLATGYQYNQMGTDTNITTEAYDDHDQGVAKIITRYVNDEYDNTTEALNSYNKTERVVNFDVADCDEVTDDEVISWYLSSMTEGTDRDLELDRRDARNSLCFSPGQNCRSSEGKLNVKMCSTFPDAIGTSCGCAEYGTSAAACQTSHLRGSGWYTDQHRNWGKVTALMIGFEGKRGRFDQRLVGFINSGIDYE